MKKQFAIFCLGFALLISSCKKETEEVDTTYPVIDVSTAAAFPKQCSVIKRGEKFLFKAAFSDNVELGSSSIDIHHNFDHHSHSTEVSECNMEPIKSPVKPYLLIKTLNIPAGQKAYSISEEITVPADVDPGDYHFLIRLTDKAGWQSIKGISIKVQ
ncbi:DUF4625 domain-containing protein [Pedobacter aquatilis]|uniref:DUF4625 domain-containing protein n=1 Tax=Pedobacter aquatilis TaxID=351343 RepID=UPI0025B5314E|nr:DUF4625 domain-containing protein [Pedobacter aquatilis]MDN3588829.1 DUF4625 domain-containing protein [Pedobacter aquatilis]